MNLDAGGNHVYPKLASTWSRDLTLAHLEHVRSAVSLDNNCTHDLNLWDRRPRHFSHVD